MLSDWLREKYEIHEPPERENVVAFDRESGEPVGVWEEGGVVPDDIYRRYLLEYPGALDELRDWINSPHCYAYDPPAWAKELAATG